MRLHCTHEPSNDNNKMFIIVQLLSISIILGILYIAMTWCHINNVFCHNFGQDQAKNETQCFKFPYVQNCSMWQSLTSPPLSFSPIMFGCCARCMTTSGGISMFVLAGTLYNTTGTGLALATFKQIKVVVLVTQIWLTST